MNILKYDISETQYLLLDLPEQLDCDECEFCKEFIVHYVDKSNSLNIPVGNTTISDLYSSLSDPKQLLLGEDILDETLQDLGFESNQFNARKQNVEKGFKYYWMGNFDKATCSYYRCWLYNDVDGNIVLQITPFYPWFSWFKDSKDCPGKIPYSKWIKNYKSIVKVIIPKERMQQWAIQADKLGEKYGVKF